MFTEDDVIHAYTRREALGDGVLVDVTETAREAGFVMPVALTAGVWAECVRVPDGMGDQDQAGRLWDVLWVLRHAIRTDRNASRSVLRFSLRVRNDDRPGEPPLVPLRAVCGPDDDGKPCVTVMRPEED